MVTVLALGSTTRSRVSTMSHAYVWAKHRHNFQVPNYIHPYRTAMIILRLYIQLLGVNFGKREAEAILSTLVVISDGASAARPWATRKVLLDFVYRCPSVQTKFKVTRIISTMKSSMKAKTAACWKIVVL